MKVRTMGRWLVAAAVIVASVVSMSSVILAGSTEGDAKVQKARRTLITLRTLDQMTALPGELGPLPAVPVPASNPQTPAKIELGKMLFFDPRLSANDHWACATCHNPSFGYSDGLPRSLGFGDEKELGRHSPTVINIAYNSAQFWDGRAATMEDQATGPIVAAREMNSDPQQMINEVSDIPYYREKFKEVFGGPPTMKTVGMAIASFERTIVTGESRFDRYAKGDKKALTDQEKRGLTMFISKAACTQCHNGPNFTDNSFQNLGVPQEGPLAEDLGRYGVTKDAKDKGAFKVPSLRNIAMTPPYMHTGVFKTLEEVMDFYNKGGGPSPNKSPKILPLNMTDSEKKDLVAFLKTLTGDLPQIVPPQLPPRS
ncbi:MAG TPA: cytochrome-c peroxidase [Nitrospiria bacterium]|nr:cytochrome-c peroxidase [Nitrospiria bacterium]